MTHARIAGENLLYPDIFDTGIRAAIIYKKWKLITGFGHFIFAQRVCPELQTPEYLDSKLNKTGNVEYWAKYYWAEKYCLQSEYVDSELNKTRNVKLFNLDRDPSETNDLFFERQDIVVKLLERLRFHYNNSVAVSYPRPTSKWNPPRLHNVVLPWL